MKIKSTNFGVCIDSFRAYGIKEGKYGVAIICNDVLCEAAAVFTKSSIKGAHIKADKRRLSGGIQALIVNSGNANAYVKDGYRDAEKICEIAAKILDLDKEKVGLASTGITGRRIDVEKIKAIAEKVKRKLTNSPEGSIKAAEAIMTTDRVPKQLSFEYKGIKVGAIAKGSGMIAPNMATMLCFITTNAAIPREKLQKTLKESVEDTLNMLVVDGDTSPNDTVLLLSNKRKECRIEDFKRILMHLLEEMAKKLAKDGEGATKLIEVEVTKAKNKMKAKKIAKAIVSSPLVKSAIAGENPNWGRIIAAASSKEKIELKKIDLRYESELGTAEVLNKGDFRPLDKAEKVLKGKEIRITLSLNEGKYSATAWGCDLTEEYVKINAEYN